jgi:benzoyl-CoA reductase/2-hydroxyglutaryl-CoA dehydratase subunit BcrC/BadD/HgdB
VTETCPYFAASDLLVGETTCDGKKKMYEHLGRIKPLHLLHLPAAAGEPQLASWLGEVRRFRDILEQATGRTVADATLRAEIRLQNEVRQLTGEILRTAAGPNAPLTGLDMMLVTEAKNFFADPADYAAALRGLLAELRDFSGRAPRPGPAHPPHRLPGGPRLGKGHPAGGGVRRPGGRGRELHRIKGFDLLVDEDPAADPLEALARRYLRIPCSVMTPNSGRLDLLDSLVREFAPAGVIDLTWQCCHTYNVESPLVAEHLRQKHALPLLHLETDYSASDTEQLRTRIEAFLEMF